MNPVTRVVSFRRFVSLFLVLSAIAFAAGCNGSYGGGSQSVSVQIAPKTASVKTGQTQQFTATVYGASNTAVTWAVNGNTAGSSAVGTISVTGLYTPPAAPPNPANVMVVAISQADSTKSDTATVTVTDGTPPTAPSVLSATAAAPSQINLSWTASTDNVGVTGYQIQRCSGSGCTPSMQVGTSTNTTFNDTGLTVSTSYSYRVSATDAAGNVSAFSNVATATTPGASGIAVSITPLRGGLTITQNLSVKATVTGDSANLGVTWSFTSTGPTTAGMFSSNSSPSGTPVTFTAPSGAGIVTVTATSVADVTQSASATIGVTDLTGVFTYHNDILRTGANTKEYALTTSTVTTATFGKLFTCSVDAAIYAQPLWVANLSFGGTKHNVVYVVTQHDSIYAFDADANPCVTLWSKVGTNANSLIPSGETWVTSGDVSCGDLAPDIGIVGTPVIDPASNTIYLVTKTKNTAGTSFLQRIHALDLITGAEKTGSPADISGTVSGTANGSVGGILTFDTKVHNQRSALLLEGGHLIIMWASHCDFGTYNGWVMSYNASTLAQEATFSATPNGALGGIWMAGGGPAADSSGNIYFATGNGTFDSANHNYGDAIVKLAAPSGGTFSVATFFSPSDQDTLRINDTDLGSGGLVLLPDLPSGTHPQLLAQAGKDSRFWIANRNSLGGNTTPAGSPNTVVQELDNALPGGMWGSPAYWNGHIYFGAAQDQGVGSSPTDPLRDFSFNTTTGAVALATSTTKIYAFTGPTPSVSSNGTTAGTGVLWALDDQAWASTPCSSVITCQGLYAYDATNLATELWDSNQAQTPSNRDLDGGAVKFAVPTVANGKVYVGNQTTLTVYGLLPN